MSRSVLRLVPLCWLCWTVLAGAADPFSQLPGHGNYQKVRDESRRIGADGRLSEVQWSTDGATVSFQGKDARMQVNLSTLAIEPATESDAKTDPSGENGRRRRGRAGRQPVGRAQQSAWVQSPNGEWVARYVDYNIVLERAATEKSEGGEPTAAAKPADAPPRANEEDAAAQKSEVVPVTISGSQYFRYGTACWVYGEELFQDSAMWWSPDSKRLAFYEIDERHMPDYYLTLDNIGVLTRLHAERYPTAGNPNPYVGLLVYDLDTKLTTRVDVGGDRLQYVYDVRFTPDGKELLFSRTNRRQDVLEIMAAELTSGQTRVVVREQQPTWQNNKPLLQFLSDGHRFIWETERSGWKQYELRNLDGSLVNPLTPVAAYAAAGVVQVDEAAGWFYYTAYSSENPLDVQLHRVRLDGTQAARLTPRSLHHSGFQIAPDHKWFVATYEALNAPPVTALFNDRGEEVLGLATSDVSKVAELGLTPPELFTFKANDGVTDLQGILFKPAHFDPNRKYPLVINVYGGPSSRGISNNYDPADPYCEFGFLVATIANRGTTERGKAFEAATYLQLGTVDIQDQADGVRFLAQRPYVDATRVGILGHSYGGFMSALAVLRYPDVFHVGVAGAPVTDWKNYDTIYTERYMRTPQENPDGYREGSCLTYVEQFKGKLLLMHGLVDDNVHPSNTWQLVDALQKRDLRFDLMVYPESEHGLGPGSAAIRWEYLHEHLDPEPITLTDP